jgi:hypothetical protein
MAQEEVSGHDIWLGIDPAGGTNWVTIVCLTSNGINLSTDTINSSSKCGTSSSPGTQTMDVPFEGNYMKNPDGTSISGADLFTLAKEKTNFSWIQATLDAIGGSPAQGDDIYTGTGFISSLSITFPDGTATFSGTISSDDITLVTES